MLNRRWILLLLVSMLISPGCPTVLDDDDAANDDDATTDDDDSSTDDDDATTDDDDATTDDDDATTDDDDSSTDDDDSSTDDDDSSTDDDDSSTDDDDATTDDDDATADDDDATGDDDDSTGPVVVAGNTTASGSTGGGLVAAYPYGHPITLANDALVTGLGVICLTSGVEFVLGLYSHSGGSPGSPGSLILETATGTCPGSNLELAVASPVMVSAGNYWIASHMNAIAALSLGVGPSSYIAVGGSTTYTGTMPASWPSFIVDPSSPHNYYILGN